MQEEFSKDDAIEKMTEDLRVLRNKLNLTQDELARKVGISRQTLINIENKKRTMSWSTFVALLTVFRAERSTSNLLDHLDIYTRELNTFLISPKANN